MRPVDHALNPDSKIPSDCIIDCYKIDIHLQPLIDELQELWHFGIETYEISKSKTFQLKYALIWTIIEFPVYDTLSGSSTNGRVLMMNWHVPYV